MNPVGLGVAMLAWYLILLVAGIRRDRASTADPTEFAASKLRGFLLVCFIAALLLVVGMVFKLAFIFPLMAILVGSYSTWAGVAHLRNPSNIVGAIPGLGERTFRGVFARLFGFFALGIGYWLLVQKVVPPSFR